MTQEEKTRGLEDPKLMEWIVEGAKAARRSIDRYIEERTAEYDRQRENSGA